MNKPCSGLSLAEDDLDLTTDGLGIKIYAASRNGRKDVCL
jgi:hypothetical protein